MICIKVQNATQKEEVIKLILSMGKTYAGETRIGRLTCCFSTNFYIRADVNGCSDYTGMHSPDSYFTTIQVEDEIPLEFHEELNL